LADKPDALKILVVDDEKDIREGVQRILTRMGYTVLTAGQGEEALKILENERVDLAILDLKMPGMDGMELHHRLRVIDEKIIVIIITGYATIETAIEQAQENVRINEERFKEQVATSTDVLTAQTLLARTMNSYYSALYDFKIAKASLYREMGQEISE